MCQQYFLIVGLRQARKRRKKSKYKNRSDMTSKMSIQGLLPKVREHWFTESCRQLLTIVLVKTLSLIHI